MIAHNDLGLHHFTQSRRLWQFIQVGEITFAGNKRLMTYGTLQCASGKKMKIGNRVFFRDKMEAIAMGYRPCGHCMRSEYIQWKNKNGHVI